MKPGASAPPPSISWLRAVLTALAILVAVVLALVVGPDQFLDRVDLDRSVKVGLVTAWFLVGLLAVAWGLRRLQSRGLI